jgi:hypothetical protein
VKKAAGIALGLLLCFYFLAYAVLRLQESIMQFPSRLILLFNYLVLLLENLGTFP